jgi:antitoxin (DNA-binding transcriptional repressor) of toxin-antitoxin stability system
MSRAKPPRRPLTVKVHEAKTTLSRLIARVLAGERVIIARADTPVVELVPVQAAATGPRRFGALRGVVSVTPAFFDPLPAAELDAWNS